MHGPSELNTVVLPGQRPPGPPYWAETFIWSQILTLLSQLHIIFLTMQSVVQTTHCEKNG